MSHLQYNVGLSNVVVGLSDTMTRSDKTSWKTLPHDRIPRSGIIPLIPYDPVIPLRIIIPSLQYNHTYCLHNLYRKSDDDQNILAHTQPPHTPHTNARAGAHTYPSLAECYLIDLAYRDHSKIAKLPEIQFRDRVLTMKPTTSFLCAC